MLDTSSFESTGLYVHWPFCSAKCPYCDFNSYVSDQVDAFRWLRAYQSELSRLASEMPSRTLTSVFFGGGTPSLMDPEIIAELLNQLACHWKIASDIEITVEANPSSVDNQKFQDFRAAGVNRLSLGVQALNDKDLARLGRQHTTAESLEAIAISRQCFDRVSIDVIYGRQHQTVTDWEQELASVLSFGLDHLSLYQLTIEPRTAFGDRFAAGKLNGLPDEQCAVDMMHLNYSACDDAGLSAYEVSNFARPSEQSRHNLTYWRCGDYLAIGPGAHGRVSIEDTRYATETVKLPEFWLRSVETGVGAEARRRLSTSEQATEYLIMGLRLVEGIDRHRYEKLAGVPIAESSIAALQDLDLIEPSAGRLATTRRGAMLLNAVISELLPTNSR
ncbi:MAG: radical SAM family heme chaperone HemW [Aestuariivita sp.]|nr:radical SAM family heme chaperone HemW [Aestuariivita sp.]MCY4202562.1 radical SAM family heme chaperone HemW [Aestuariivita sp.]